MTVLATAGHVDHGKSTLVNFLTGQETDRLKEEKQRGLTINLGYTYFEYKSKIFSIVDVPGHSDYFKNTINGFSNVDGVLFCVDTTQGWSQQSEEHFLSLHKLGINNLLFFLTKTDKEESTFNVSDLESKLRNFKDLQYGVIEFSSINSDKLTIKKSIFEFFNKVENISNPPSMWVDRVFTIEGIGKVVTGTASKDMEFENIFVGNQESVLDIREIQTIGKKIISSSSSSSRLAISIKKNNAYEIKKGNLLTNKKMKSKNFIFINTETDEKNLFRKGTLRLFIGTHNQIIKNYTTININKKTIGIIHLSESLCTPDYQKVLLHNLSKNTFNGGSVIFSTNNTFLISKIVKNFKKQKNVDSEIFFTMIPEYFTKGEIAYKKIGELYIANEKLAAVEENLKSNIEIVNKFGLRKYLFENFFVDEKEIDDLSKHFSSLKINNDQVSKNLVKNIDINIFNEINNLLGNSLNVEIVELEKYDSEVVKSLFMNGYLFRVSEKLIISKNQRSDLIKIIEKLPQDFSVKDFKEVSNLSRKYTIPFLEFLDRQLITKKINSEGRRRRID
jgi:selenocysteine-specific elongation factor